MSDLVMELGRNVNHDPRSRNFAHEPDRSVTVQSALHRFDAPILDQGHIGSCTGNALTQWLNTWANMQGRTVFNGRYLSEANAQQMYSWATWMDDDQDPAHWPSNDTGSSGLAVCKGGVRLGFLTGYQHVFDFDTMLQTLQTTPVIVGTDWTRGMFNPGTNGLVSTSGDVVGGHEYLVVGINMETQEVMCINSWSANWGVNGRFKIGFNDFRGLLDNQGDITVPIVK